VFNSQTQTSGYLFVVKIGILGYQVVDQGPPVIEMKVVFHGETDGPEDAVRRGGGFATCFPDHYLGYPGGFIRGPARGQFPGRFHDQVTRSEGIDPHVGQIVLDRLEAADGPPELNPFHGVGHRHFPGPHA